MGACIYNTDPDWIAAIREYNIKNGANFWRKDQRSLALQPGSYFYFKLRGSRAIVGRGQFREQQTMDIPSAWRLFGHGNGVASEEELRTRASSVLNLTLDAPINCLVFDNIQLLPPQRYFDISLARFPNGIMGPKFYEEGELEDVAAAFETHAGPYRHRELAEAETILRNQGLFDPATIETARQYQLRAICQRMGQSAFRLTLLGAYLGRCSVSDCDAVEALEAAHIIPYKGAATNTIQNGLLLRSDLHTLFDLGSWTLSDDYRVILSPRLINTVYAQFDTQPLRLPNQTNLFPSVEAIRHHRQNTFARD